MYADKEYYTETYGGSLIGEKELTRLLEKASRQIDTLTFCRIREIGFDRLTAFQQDQIQYVTCMLADFIYENQDELESMLLSSYGINGVSMTFSSGVNVTKVQGVVIRTDIYAELDKTGLCCRMI
uniref:Head Tail Connector Protein n=1 Tax=Siphoviridae sp. ctr4Z12 TaxID=2827280 RepID=A0A8S5R5L4_9CAUD|nr:MAG TPA: Head Tail Connector Protein [Siphoviridae sp. ctr4Z12]